MGSTTTADGSGSTDITVELGDVAFDPVATQDFRLSIEGTSGVGKSNSMAVILEDLADVAIPTLIIERLGALSTTRVEDDSIVVVGAREEEGVDLAVGIDELDQIGSWILDRGMKVLLDVSTYADYEEEKSRVHLAAAIAIQSLNDRAHEKYRSGDRTKSLLVVDEAHYMAPKDTAPEPELDDWVRRCRSQLIKASTEGGNKGISIVVGYQRRAFLHNGVIQLAQDFIAHKPGDEDIGRTAEALRCSEDDLADLEVGEIMAKGPSITDSELVGPTRVRKRRSPDPRDETFDLPETPEELTDVLDEIQSEVEAERERRTEREDELERLREENERLRDRVEELEQELEDTDRMASALERLGQGGNGGAATEVGEAASDLQERVDELKDERDEIAEMRDQYAEELAEVTEENAELREEVADLEAEIQELRSAFRAATEEIEALGEIFEVEVDVGSPTEQDAGGEEVERLQERIDELEAEKQRLESQVDAEVSETLESYEDFLDLDVVQEEIEAAKDERASTAVRGILASIIQEGGWVHYDTVAERIGHSQNKTVSAAASELERRKIVKKDQRDDGMYVDLNTDGIAEIRQAAAEREKTEELMEEL